MTEASEQKESAAAPKFSTDTAIVQIREVVKWLIGGFAAVGVALAAGSQLSEIGDLDGLRLVAAIGAVMLTLAGIVAAIVYATRVMTPRPVGLSELVAGEKTSATGARIRQEPDLLMEYGNSIAEFAERRDEILEEAADAWKAYEGDEDDEKLRARAMRTQEEKTRVNAAMQWLFSFSRYTETARLFNRSLRAMVAAAVIAAFGIAGFAWAAHPEEDKGKEEPAATVVAKAPVLVDVDLSRRGKEAEADDLGKRCDMDSFEAIAVAGTAASPEIVSVPNAECALDRFTLSTLLGTYTSLEPLVRPAEVPPHG